MDPTTTDPTDQQPSDPMAEIKAMTAVAEAFKGLSRLPIERVLEWANKHYLGHSAAPVRQRPAAHSALPELQAIEVGEDRIDFPTLLGGARASSGVDRALLCGYYLQTIVGQGDFDSFSLNRELKNAGHASGNITRDLDGLMAKTPQLVIQTRKQGTTRQARKLYRLTAAGVAAAKQLLAPVPATE